MKKKLIAIAAVPVLVFSSCSLTNVRKLKYSDTANEKITIEDTGIKALDVDIEVGNCNISYGNVKSPEISVEYKFRGISQKEIDKAKNKVGVEYNVKKDILYIEFEQPENGIPKKVEAEADIDIVMPEGDYDFDIDSEIGDIYLDALCGSFDIEGEVNDIELNDVTVMRDSDIYSEVGDVRVNLKSAEKSTLYIETEVGDITLDAGELNVNEKKSSNDVAGERITVEVDEKCTVKMNTEVGEIDLR